MGDTFSTFDQSPRSCTLKSALASRSHQCRCSCGISWVIRVVSLSVVALMFAMLAVVFSVLAVHRLSRVGHDVGADRIARSPRIDNGGPPVNTRPDARKVRLVGGR